MAKVLITGSAGSIGLPACTELERRGHAVRAFDRVPTPGVRDAVVADVTDREAVLRATEGVDAIVHLAAHPDDADFELLVGPNVRGLFHVMDAARKHAVRRVVLASSIQVIGRWRDAQRPFGTDEASPGNHYALTKVWAERMGEMYVRCYGMSVIAARIAWMVRNPEEARRMAAKRRFDFYLSRGDVARFLSQAVEATGVDFAVLYAIGPDGGDVVDLESSRRVIGYEPRDAWPDGLGFDIDELASSADDGG
jgi:nucleoside-diphosphate-sugar epimerase